MPLRAGPKAGRLLFSKASPLKPEWATEKEKSTMKRYSLRPNTAILRRSRWGQKTDIERPLDEGGWACAEPSSPGPPPPPHTHLEGQGGKTVGGPKAKSLCLQSPRMLHIKGTLTVGKWSSWEPGSWGGLMLSTSCFNKAEGWSEQLSP